MSLVEADKYAEAMHAFNTRVRSPAPAESLVRVGQVTRICLSESFPPAPPAPSTPPRRPPPPRFLGQRDVLVAAHQSSIYT